MLGVILTILKIIGIVLLSLIWIVLFVLILLLFWPFFYKVTADSASLYFVKANLSWLFHIFSFWILPTENKKIMLYAYVFGIKVYTKELYSFSSSTNDDDLEEFDDSEFDDFDEDFFTDIEEKTDGDFTENKIESSVDREQLTNDIDYEHIKNEENNFDDKIKSTIKEDNVNADDSDEEFKTAFSLFEFVQDSFEKLLDFIFNIPDRVDDFIANFDSRLKVYYDKYKYYDKLINSKGGKYAIDFLWDKTKKLIVHLLPYGSEIKIDYSSTDFEKPVKLMMLYGMALPYLPRKTVVNTGIDKDEFLFDVKIKGKFFLWYILLLVAEVFYNKRAMAFIERFRRGL